MYCGSCKIAKNNGVSDNGQCFAVIAFFKDVNAYAPLWERKMETN